MHEDHPNFQQPANLDAKIWRYVDFTKFVSMLDSGSLHFVRPYCLQDKYEGSFSKAHLRAQQQAIESGERPGWTRDHLKSALEGHRDALRTQTALNCWHANEHESAAMWKVYLKSDEGVAIQSTVRRLRDCFDNDPTVLVFVGLVQYADYDEEQIPWGNAFMPLLYKRASFKHEQELRAVAVKSAVSSPGSPPYLSMEQFNPGATPIPVDLDRLIERVLVAPTSEAWFEDLVRRILERYQLNKEVMRSSLADGPLY